MTSKAHVNSHTLRDALVPTSMLYHTACHGSTEIACLFHSGRFLTLQHQKKQR